MNIGRFRTIRYAILAAAILVATGPPRGGHDALAAAQDRGGFRTLDIYVIDVEGGNATLFVSASRDHLITTHYHGDHFGAMAELAGRIPIRELIDHGPGVEKNPGTDAFLQNVYPTLYATSRHTVVQPGHRFSLGDVDVRMASAGRPASAVSSRSGPAELCLDTAA